MTVGFRPAEAQAGRRTRSGSGRPRTPTAATAALLQWGPSPSSMVPSRRCEPSSHAFWLRLSVLERFELTLTALGVGVSQPQRIRSRCLAILRGSVRRLPPPSRPSALLSASYRASTPAQQLPPGTGKRRGQPRRTRSPGVPQPGGTAAREPTAGCAAGGATAGQRPLPCAGTASAGAGTAGAGTPGPLGCWPMPSRGLSRPAADGGGLWWSMRASMKRK